MFYSRVTKLHKIWHTPHYVTFLDILGFSALVRRIREEPELFFLIREALSGISQYSARLVNSQPIMPTGERIHLVRAKHFSDSIILSAPAEPLGCLLVIEGTAELVTTLLRLGVLVRGGIAHGQLFHDESVVFGEGLIAAYRLESEFADFPRVLIERDVAETMSRLDIDFGGIGPISELSMQEQDSQLALDFLHPKVLTSVARKQHESLSDFLAAIAATLNAELRRDLSKGVRRKLDYLAAYFNRALERVSLQRLKIDTIKSGTGSH